MNTELFIANRISSNKIAGGGISQGVIRIAIIAIALSITVMILSVAIITGFHQQIKDKVMGFGSHILISNHDSNTSYEPIPIPKNQNFYPSITTNKGINHIQVFATKAGIIKTKTDIQGVVVKGIGSDFDWRFFNRNLIKGRTFTVNDTVKTYDVIISKSIANLLKLDVDDAIFMYFISQQGTQKTPRPRKYKIVGIYETAIEEIDKRYIIADIKDIQDINGWTRNQVGGFEITIDHYDNLSKMTDLVYDIAGFQLNEDGTKLKVTNINEEFSQIFDWLQLTKMNVWVILALMLIVSIINMVSGLLILILEKTNMIGVLKALGLSDWSVRKIFLYNAAYIVGRGVIVGNIIGITLCLLQYYFKIIPLDPDSYYVNTVPINLKITHLLLLNFLTLVFTIATQIIPSWIITRIEPIKAIQFN